MSEKLCFEVVLSPNSDSRMGLITTHLRIFDWNSCKTLHMCLQEKMFGLVSRSSVLARVVNSGTLQITPGSLVHISDACYCFSYIPLSAYGQNSIPEVLKERGRQLRREALAVDLHSLSS